MRVVGLGAAREVVPGNPLGIVARVRLHMPHESGVLCEGLGAEGALIRSLPGVRALVGQQVGAVGRRVRAEGAAVAGAVWRWQGQPPGGW